MKRNELFKSLMNVQSQVTSLMNVVLQEANEAPSLNGHVQGVISGIGAQIPGLAPVTKLMEDACAKYLERNDKVRDDAIKNGFAEIEKNAKLSKESLTKVENLVHKMRLEAAQDVDVKNTCKYVGIALLAVSCVLGYLMFPGLKENFIAAFNSGNPLFERFGSLIKAVAKSSLIVFLLGIGVILCYHGFKGIDMFNSYAESFLRIVARIRVEFDNMIGKLKAKTGEGISAQVPAWQW